MIKEQQYYDEIREIVAQIIEIEPERVGPDLRFVEDLGMDSMMALEILASLEKRYKIHIPEDELAKARTLKDTVDIVKRYAK